MFSTDSQAILITDIDTQFSSKAARSMLGKQMEKERAGTASRSDTTGSFGHAIRTAAGGEPPHGKNDLVGEHPAMQVPNVTESGDAQNIVSAQAAEENRQQDNANSALGDASKKSPDASDSGFSASSEDASAHNTTDQTRQSHPGEADEGYQEGEGGDGPEVLRTDYDEADRDGKGHLAALTEHLNAATLHVEGTAKDDGNLDDFRPHILHAPHSPVPMALVNRVPRGSEYLPISIRST